MQFIRRTVLLGALMGAISAWAQSTDAIDVFKSANCSYCEKWIAHVKENGLQIKALNVIDVSAVHKAMGMPDRFASWHTSRIGDFLDAPKFAGDGKQWASRL